MFTFFKLLFPVGLVRKILLIFEQHKPERVHYLFGVGAIKYLRFTSDFSSLKVPSKEKWRKEKVRRPPPAGAHRAEEAEGGLQSTATTSKEEKSSTNNGDGDDDDGGGGGAIRVKPRPAATDHV